MPIATISGHPVDLSNVVVVAAALASVEATHLLVVLQDLVHHVLSVLSKNSSLEISPVEVPHLDLSALAEV